MRSPSKASRAAYKRCPETCQKVRAEISEALEKVVAASFENYSCEFLAELTDAAFDAALAHGTEPLRNALIDCEEELLETRDALDIAESDRESYRCDAIRWEDQANKLEGGVESLRSELDEARGS